MFSEYTFLQKSLRQKSSEQEISLSISPCKDFFFKDKKMTFCGIYFIFCNSILQLFILFLLKIIISENSRRCQGTFQDLLQSVFGVAQTYIWIVKNTKFFFRILILFFSDFG